MDLMGLRAAAVVALAVGTMALRAAVPSFADGDRVAVFGPGESEFGTNVAVRLQLSWNLDHPGVPVDFPDATYRRDTLKDAFRRWTVDVAGPRATHVLSFFGAVPGSAGFEHDLRLLVLKARSEGRTPLLAIPQEGADVVRRVAREENVEIVDLRALLTKDRADAPENARAAFDGLSACERTLRTYDDMRFAALAHGMYLGDDIQDEPPTIDAWTWWLKANGREHIGEVELWKTLYGHEPEWRAKAEAFRTELRERTK